MGLRLTQVRRRTLVGVLMLLLVVWAVQFLYPTSRSLPFAHIADIDVGFSTNDTIARTLASRYSTIPLQLQVPRTATLIDTTFNKVGFSVDTERAFSSVNTYPWWQRLIPLSLLIRGATTDASVYARADTIRFKEFVASSLAQCRVEPVNAGVRIVNGAAELAPAKEGYQCDATQLARTLERTPIPNHTVKIEVPLKKLMPQRSDKDIAPLLDVAQSALARQLILQADTGGAAVPASELAGWLRFDENPDGRLAIALDQTRVGVYVRSAHKSVRISPRATIVSTLDGVETGRTLGTPGRDIDDAKTAEAINKAWLEGTRKVATATVAVRPVAPAVQFSRAYSPTQAGLQALLADIAKDKGDYAISIRRANGEETQINGSKQYHPASTYKMYVAWGVLKRIEAGQMKWTDSAENGKTIEQCFDAMIVNSDNPCGEWFGVKLGWSSLNTQLKGIGLTCTNLSTAWLSCARDETFFLEKLVSGQILTDVSRDRLLDVMKKQTYRAGIPAGVGVPVADKVGFIDGYLHDAAVVYSPKGTYQLTIMTRGSSWSQIADAARQIQAQLERM